MATKATLKKACKSIVFVPTSTSWVRVVGPASYYIKDRLKSRGAQWSPRDKEWTILSSVLDLKFQSELETIADAAMPKVLARQESKIRIELENFAREQLKAEGHPAFVIDTEKPMTDEAIEMQGDQMLLAIDERVKKIRASQEEARAAAAPLISCGFCFSEDASTCPCSVAADEIDAKQASK
jgi:hypothetical protein